MTDMGKHLKKPRKYSENKTSSKLEEPFATYRPVKKLAVAADFPFSRFKKIANLVPFTLNDWANILHLSERTLQRYSKNNNAFEGIYADRILHIEQLIQRGLETFGDAVFLYDWLHREKKILGVNLNFQSLYTTRGIQDLINQMERIQQGVYT